MVCPCEKLYSYMDMMIIVYYILLEKREQPDFNVSQLKMSLTGYTLLNVVIDLMLETIF